MLSIIVLFYIFIVLLHRVVHLSVERQGELQVIEIVLHMLSLISTLNLEHLNNLGTCLKLETAYACTYNNNRSLFQWNLENVW